MAVETRPSRARVSSGAVVVDTTCSPYARLRPVPLTAVTLEDGFWAPRRGLNREVTLPSQYRHCEETGRIDNFRRAAGKKQIPFQGIYFNDSDVYKWLEAAAFTIATDPDPELEAMMEIVATEIADAQQADGYLNTYFMFEKAGERWGNLRDMHELYCAGHFLQAAVALHRATGSERLLTVACRLAGHLCARFGRGEGQHLGTCGHPEIEMALVELARETGDAAYLRQAQFFVDVRGQKPPVAGGSDYHQDHKPFRELDRMVGHAVRALYLAAGAADLHAETGEEALRATLDRLWSAMTERQMYVTGGLGARYAGEAFGKEYELPNARAYAETCAAIGSIMWNWRMLALEGDARSADVLETALYNGALAGLSLDGQSYFYQNPLEDDGTHRRRAWFGCACCPPNIARLLASLPGLFYSTSDEGIWVHLYAEGTADIALPDGRTVRLEQRTRYPWDGEVEIRLNGEGEFSLFLRVPGWSEEAALEAGGQQSRGASRNTLTPGTYAEIRRAWRRGDAVRLSLPMPARRIECHPGVSENWGRVALARGPLVYCVEQVDLAGVDPRELLLPDDSSLTPQFRPELLGGVVVLRGRAEVASPDTGWEGRLYRTVRPGAAGPRRQREVELTAVPYYAWANREPGAMQVWLRRGQLD